MVQLTLKITAMKQLIIRTDAGKAANTFFVLPVIAVEKNGNTIQFIFAWMRWLAEIGFRPGQD